jgi:hypothetical protein
VKAAILRAPKFIKILIGESLLQQSFTLQIDEVALLYVSIVHRVKIKGERISNTPVIFQFVLNKVIVKRVHEIFQMTQNIALNPIWDRL